MKRVLTVFVSAFLCFSALASNAPRRVAGASVLTLFATGDFLPHVPTLADIRVELGALQEAHVAQDRVFTYRVARNGWLTLRTNEAPEERYTAIEEVIYSRFSPTLASSKQMVGKKLLSSQLMGISLGDSVSKLKNSGIKFRKNIVELFGRKVTAYECTPKVGEDDLFYRYFIIDNRVEAFSIGVTE